MTTTTTTKLSMVALLVAAMAGCSNGEATNVEAESPASAEARDPQGIQRTVRESFDEIRACYESALEQSPALSGKVVFEFSIDPDGAAVEPEVGAASTLRDPVMESCMIDVFASMEFDPAGVTTTVTYPVAFSPS